MKKVNNDLSSWIIIIMKTLTSLFLVPVFFFFSCIESKEFTPLEKNTMIEILKDMHLQSATLDVAKPIIPDSLNLLLGHLSSKNILEDYNIDSTFFIQSIEFYLKDDQTMLDMYEKISSTIEHKLNELKKEEELSKIPPLDD